jgi:O-antigen/teichoic acid export membrane protein
MSPLSSFSGLLVPEFAESMACGDGGRMRRMANEALNTTLIYAAAVSVFLYVFSEELGFVVYGSSAAGRYIAVLSCVVPIMYLDHVTDAMLKGIGEHVYSMWVNITDSLLSVFLIWFLIPEMGISGYAWVIIIMEGYNFLLSFIKLKARIKFSAKTLFACILPFFEAIFAAFVADSIFAFSGSLTTAWQLVMKIVFSLSVFIALNLTENLIFKRKAQHA